MYSLLEYSDNYSMTSGSLGNYHRDEINHDANETNNNDKMTNNNKTTTSKNFKYKTKRIGTTSRNNSRLKAEIIVPLKYLSNFWRYLDLSLINWEINIDLRWTKNCVLSEVSRTFREVDPNVDPVVYQVATATTGAIFQVTNAKLFVAVVTLSNNDSIKLLENIKQGFKRTISWNKYRSEVTALPKSSNLHYLIDQAFININRTFLLLIKNGSNDPTRNSFDEFYRPLTEIKYLNGLIDNKPFFDQPVKNKQEPYEKLIKMSKMMSIQYEIY